MPALNRKQRLSKTSRIIAQVGKYASQGDKDRAFKAMFDGFAELGGVYVKFLQIISARSEFKHMSSVSMAERTKVFDDVMPDEVDLQGVLMREIGPVYQQHLTNIANKPFAAGSFGQVYYAQHRDGTPVIIKVLRPSLIHYIRFDLRVLKVIARLIDAGGLVRSFYMSDIFADFRQTVLTETDYPHEVDNAVYFYNYFQDHPYVVIPKSYPVLSSKSVLVQQYVGGLPLTDVMRRFYEGEDIDEYVRRELGSDLRLQLKELGHELLFCALGADRVPGDPHAGNIKLLPNNQVALFDFGITAAPPDNRLAFKQMVNEYLQIYEDNFDIGRFFVNGLRFFANRQFRAINTVAAAVKGSDPNFDIIGEIQRLAVQGLERSKSQVDIKSYLANAEMAPIFRDAINENNKFAINLEFDGGAMLKAADTYSSMLDRLGMKNEILPTVYTSVLARVDKGEGVKLKGHNDLMNLEQAIEIVSAWMEDLMERDPLVFQGFVSRTQKSLSRAGQNRATPVTIHADIKEQP